MERVSALGRSLCLLILLILISGCSPARMPDIAKATPFLQGDNYALLISSEEKEDILAQYSTLFDTVEAQEEHEEGVSITFRHKGNLYNLTLVPNDITPEGGWAVFLVRPN